jgi:uncharacterized protein
VPGAVQHRAMTAMTLDHLRRYAIARTLFKPTTLGRAIERLGFVQADPIRAPARAQDLTLRHRVAGYRAGDLERRYPRLGIEEDFFVNYGFLPRRHHALMHPRIARTEWSSARQGQADAVLAFVRERGIVHPREVDAHFAHGKAVNWFGGASNASTQLLDAMHYRGLLRVARREGGTRVYAAREVSERKTDARETAALEEAAREEAAREFAASGSATREGAEREGAAREGAAREVAAPEVATRVGAAPPPGAETATARMDALVDLVVAKYAPLPSATLGQLMSLLCGGVPQWAGQRAAALARAKARLAHHRLDGTVWYWPADERPQSSRWRPDAQVRLLTPFDPVVWDRRRFEAFWGWAYRFEAYTPAPKRRLGYYALPLLWHERVIGWANASVVGGALVCEFGYVAGRAPRDAAYRAALGDELERLRVFLGLDAA